MVYFGMTVLVNLCPLKLKGQWYVLYANLVVKCIAHF